MWRRRGAIHYSPHPTVAKKISHATWLKSYFKKNELTPSRKRNTRLENYFYHFKIPIWLVIQNTIFSENNNRIILLINYHAHAIKILKSHSTPNRNSSAILKYLVECTSQSLRKFTDFH